MTCSTSYSLYDTLRIFRMYVHVYACMYVCISFVRVVYQVSHSFGSLRPVTIVRQVSLVSTVMLVSLDR